MKEDFEKLQQERVRMKIFIDVGSRGLGGKVIVSCQKDFG